MSAIELPQLREPWRRMTIQFLADRAAQESPARLFIEDCPFRLSWNGIEPKKLSFSAFKEQAEFLANQLYTLGVESGETVLILLPNVVEVSLAILACQLAGAVPAIAAIDERVDMLRAAAERSEAVMILTTGWVGDIELSDKARQVAAKALRVRCVAAFGHDLPDGVVSLEEWTPEELAPFSPYKSRQFDTGLITFVREKNSLIAAIRSEAQMLAEALAISSVMRLDGRRGVISLMHPGAAASVAATFTLPLYAGSYTRLVGPFDQNAIGHVLRNDPTAHLFGPDHFMAFLKSEGVGGGHLNNSAGLLALTRAETPHSRIMRPGMLDTKLIIDFSEHGFMTANLWPEDGSLYLSPSYYHPFETVLGDEELMLEYVRATWQGSPWLGFGAAQMIERGQAIPRNVMPKQDKILDILSPYSASLAEEGAVRSLSWQDPNQGQRKEKDGKVAA